VADRTERWIAAVERAARDLLVALGADLETEGLRETPPADGGRLRGAAHAGFNLTTFPNDEGCDDLVVVGDIPCHSLCMQLTAAAQCR